MIVQVIPERVDQIDGVVSGSSISMAGEQYCKQKRKHSPLSTTKLNGHLDYPPRHSCARPTTLAVFQYGHSYRTVIMKAGLDWCECTMTAMSMEGHSLYTSSTNTAVCHQVTYTLWQ